MTPFGMTTVFFLLFIIYVLLFGSSEFHRKGLVGRLNLFLTYYLWVNVMKFLKRICPGFMYRRTEQCFSCLSSKNPFLQIFYLCLVGGGYILFLLFGMQYVPGPFLGIHHKFIFHVFVWLVLGWFMHVCYSDPGVVNTNNFAKHLVKYPFDEVMYNKKLCSTCRIIRPARSKHCSICNRCVARFDHHCPWINSDVGAGNLWKFLIFLFSTGAVCNYCAWLCFYVLYGILESNQIFKAIIRTPQGDIPITWGYIIQYLTYYHGILVGLGAFCALISLVLYGFWAYHCYLISKNTTTNETFKWDDIKRYVMNREKQLISEKETTNNNNTNVKKKKQDVKKKKQQEDKKEKEEETPKLPPWTREHLVNTYNHGIRNNFYEVFYYDEFSTVALKKVTKQILC